MAGLEGVSSLLAFLDSPVVVGDPESRVVYANPAFERHFSRSAEELSGESMAMLFGGGGREALLGAVADVCTRGETVHFRLREAGAGYLGIASPIEAADDRVGVMVLLTEEPELDERLIAYQIEISQPLDEALACLEELLDQTGGRRDPAHRDMVERSIEALARARKWSDELHAALCGRSVKPDSNATLDPVRVARQVARRLEEDFAAAGVELQLLVPPQLPAVSGDAVMLETALVRLAHSRLPHAARGDAVCLSVRIYGDGETRGAVFSLVDAGRPSAFDADDAEPEPRVVRATVAALGGKLSTIEDPAIGRVTSIGLALAPAS